MAASDYEYKNKRKTKIKNMRNNNFTSRRVSSYTAGSWAQNRNTVRHTPKTLGMVSQSVILVLLVVVFGLIYATQGTRSTNYDYELNNIENEISELEARKEDLAVEKARRTSVAAAASSEVAMTMEDASPVGYAE